MQRFYINSRFKAFALESLRIIYMAIDNKTLMYENKN